MAGLIVRVDAVAAIRESRKEKHPDPVLAAALADMAGAEGIAAHLRQDRRHIQDRDAKIIREVIKHNFLLEIAPADEMVGIALDLGPDLVTLVPEKRRESTIQGGMDLAVHKDAISEIVQTLHNSSIPVSILIDPDPDQVRLAHQASADRIEIFTGKLCQASTPRQRDRSLTEIVDAAKLAHRLRLGIYAGHGLCYNTIRTLRRVDQVDSFLVGHSIAARAVLKGMETAVKDMMALIEGS